MKKLIFLLFTGVLFASNLNWYSDYRKAFEIAKNEHKYVIVDISKHDCPPCEFMKETVFSGGDVFKLLQKKFILVSIYADSGDIPDKFRKHYFNFTPAILFYNDKGRFIKGVYGARSYKEFLKDLKEVLKG